MIDGDYLDRVEASRDLACAVVIAIAPELAQARLLAVVSELTAQTLAATVACHVLAEARRDADPDTVVADFDAVLADQLPKAKDTPVYRAIEFARAGQLAKAAAAWTAFSDVCRDQLEMEPRVVLTAHVGKGYVAEMELGQLDGVGPGKHVDQWRELFSRKWRERVGG
jgi:hypothetical protein